MWIILRDWVFGNDLSLSLISVVHTAIEFAVFNAQGRHIIGHYTETRSGAR